MTLEELRARLAALETERTDIVAASEARFADEDDTTEVRDAFVVAEDGTRTRDPLAGYTADEVRQLAELDTEEALLTTRIERAERAERSAAAGHTTRPAAEFNVSPTITRDAFDYDSVRNASYGEARGQARAALEQMPQVSDEQRHTIEAKIDESSGNDTKVARLVVARSSDAYRSMFAKSITGRVQTEGLDDDERRAVKATRDAEERAAITIGTGFAFPINIDPQFTLSTANTIHPYRDLCSVRSGTAHTHHVNVLAAASFAMQADGVESGDATGADSSVQIDAQLGQGTLIYTLSSAQDLPTLESELMRSAQQGITTLESTQFRAGTAVAPQVEGLLDGTVITRVTTATTTLIDDDIFDVFNGVPEGHQGNAAWVMSMPTANAIRQLESTGGMRLWSDMSVEGQMTGPAPSRLLGAPVRQNSGFGTAPAGLVFTTTEDVAIVGDFDQGYRIYDMVGSAAVYNVPFLTGTSANLPNGTSGLLVRWRFGAGIIDAGALRIMDIA